MCSPNLNQLSAEEQHDLQKLHSTWPLSVLPDEIKPFAELLRITKPAGVFMFYLPCLYGTFLTAALGFETSLFRLLGANARLFLLSFLLRGALCTWNDIVDQDFDRRVKRTRIRALARDAISIRAAYTFLALLVGLVSLSMQSLPGKCTVYAAPFLVMHTIYPFAKRFTHHPQVLLGFAHSNGIFISLPALGRTLDIQRGYDPGLWGVAGLTSAIVFWTLLNDTIYAAQDTADDKLAGIGSTMVYWESNAKSFLRVLAALTVLSLIVTSYPLSNSSTSGGLIYIAMTCGGTAAGLFLMVEKVDLQRPESCGWWFSNGNVMIGLAIGSGLVAAYLVQA